MKTVQLMVLMAVALGGSFAAFPQTWTQTGAPSNDWYSVVCSADGSKIAAIASNGIYFSTNSGFSWFLSSTPMEALALSADGNKWAAVDGNTYIYTSTNWGTAWIAANAPTQAVYYDFTLKNIASSADGKELIVGPTVYTSSDSGMTWAEQNVGGDSIALSSDGTKLFTVIGASVGSGISEFNFSTNSGNSWFSNTAPVFFAESLASSADGKVLALFNGSSGIYISTNLGAAWFEAIPTALNVPKPQISISADGRGMIAAAAQVLYVSADSGTTWTTNNAPDGTNKGMSAAVSADGNKFIVAVYHGGIWISQATPSPSLSISLANSLQLSWLIPSTNFVLQQSFDLIHWSDVTNEPVLNFTNLQYQVTLPAPLDKAFYRLKTP